MILAVLFDLDGVLVDACDWHYHALNKALGFDITREEHLTKYNGLSTKKKLEMLISEGRIDPSRVDQIWKDKQKYTQEYIDAIKIDQSKIDLMKGLKHRGFEIGCVTNAIKDTAKLMLKKLGILEYFDIIVSNEDVTENKPSPTPYLFAFERLWVWPNETLIVEDSDVGLEAAYASKAHVLPVFNATYVTLDRVLSRVEEIEKEEDDD